ncbi:MAG: T9SS type A sorting domain-containing protein, partial [Nitrososphaerales archaeon]
HLVMQGDHKPGSNINGWNNPPWVDAQYYHFSTDITITDIRDEQKAPSSFVLKQNYPNPFNPSTKINFTVPSNFKGEMSNVSLKIYDVLGNEIVTLVNGELSPGEYEVEFNTSSFKHLPSSGIYFYTLKTSSFIQTKKMVYLK